MKETNISCSLMYLDETSFISPNGSIGQLVLVDARFFPLLGCYHLKPIHRTCSNWNYQQLNDPLLWPKNHQ